MLNENNKALNLKEDILNNTIKEKDNKISYLNSKIIDLKSSLEYFKDKFVTLISFLHKKPLFHGNYLMLIRSVNYLSHAVQ